MAEGIEMAPPPPGNERAACSMAQTGVVGSPGHCPICGKPLTGRQRTACSDRHRAALSRRKWKEDLAMVEEQLARALTRVRTLRGSTTAA